MGLKMRSLHASFRTDGSGRSYHDCQAPYPQLLDRVGIGISIHLQQTAFICSGNRFGAIGHLQLRQDGFHVELGGILRYIKHLADILVRESATEQIKRFNFAGSQGFRSGPRRNVGFQDRWKTQLSRMHTADGIHQIVEFDRLQQLSKGTRSVGGDNWFLQVKR